MHFSSPVALRGERVDLNEMRIYRHGPLPQLQMESTRDWEIQRPYVSSDGRTTGALVELICRGACYLPRAQDTIVLDRGGERLQFTGQSLQASRNGRFVFDAGFGILSGYASIRDLENGRQYRLPNLLPREESQAIADDGTLLSTEAVEQAGFGDPASLEKVLLTPLGGSSRVLFTGKGVYRASITADGRFAFLLQRTEGGKIRFLEVDTRSAAWRVLYDGDSELMEIAADLTGRRVLVRRARELLVWDRVNGWTSLFSHDEDFEAATLSDDGETVFASTRLHRMYRLGVTTGAAEQLYAPFPTQMPQASFGGYPGSMVRFSPDVVDAKLRFTVDGLGFPLLEAQAGNYDVQVPWEFRNPLSTNHYFEVTSVDSPFSLRGGFTSLDEPRAIALTYALPGLGFGQYAIASRNNGTRQVTPLDPAMPGTIVELWLTGLGPLDRPVATGERGPGNPPAKPLAPIACYLAQTNSPANGPVAVRVPSIVYAPGRVGLYRAEIEIPAGWPAGISQAFCGTAAGGSGGLLPIGPLPPTP